MNAINSYAVSTESVQQPVQIPLPKETQIVQQAHASACKDLVEIMRHSEEFVYHIMDMPQSVFNQDKLIKGNIDRQHDTLNTTIAA